MTLTPGKTEYYKIISDNMHFPLKIKFSKVKYPFKMLVSFTNSSLG